MTVYIGVDFHARQQTISYLTTEDGEMKREELDHGGMGDWGQACNSAILDSSRL